MADETQTASTSSAPAVADAPSVSKAKPAKKAPHPRSPAAQSPSVQLSKALSYFLRHGALKESLPITPDGYISVPLLLAKPRIRQIDMAPENGDFTKDGKKKLKRVTVEDIKEAVKGKEGEKKRFEMKEEGDEVFVRAVQGHSLESVTELDHVVLSLNNLQVLELREGDQGKQPEAHDKNHSEATTEEEVGQSLDGLPPGVEILHGTTPDAWEKIKASGGLSKMKRNHIHLARGRPGVPGVGSGMRPTSPLLIHIDMLSALRDGISFQLASNGAVLTAGEDSKGILPLKYVSKVEERKSGKVIWRREDGRGDNLEKV
ncbi:hypothetical protein BCV69DRAFT_296642 [Microstroma glucosiphilum]|uniref:2'-phosphotransferase n=1 Tax=Pseudomicrostroma glucosiphilum TaxID=1684307 RepID=A0A316UFJ2_9BASI|nr:hypothetical protein BCV69DRAFT_296642 [Pseudomicrostroma glucosiphilum]PWN22663.1 hypothetical protein BCV69DRAFT_296642 [Pseudomicrostroma glucosiphilum]